MSENEAVLFANEAFYHAFRGCDLEAMAEVWASEAFVTCIHPGWDAVNGRQDVLDSWESIMAGGNAPNIHCRGARAHLYDNTATVICFEEISGSFLIATNIFVREHSRWKMVHHQAGPTNATAPVDDEPEPNKVN